MRIISRIVLTFLLAAIAVTSSAETVKSVSERLDEHIRGVVGTGGTLRIPDKALMLALAETKAAVQAVAEDIADPDVSAELRAAINQQRTDLQMATTSDSPHATSIMEKPGIADLLSLALDRGAISKVANGTGLSLSTTPYAVFTGFGATDTPQRWEKAGWARNLSLSATFSSTDVTAGDFSSFSSGEIKYIIVGNRSPRDPELLRGVRTNLGTTFLITDTDLTRDCDPLLNTQPLLDAKAEMDRWLGDNAGITGIEVRAHLFEVVGEINLDRSEQALLRTCADTIMKGEQRIDASLDQVTEATQKYLDDKRNQFSLATLFVRDEKVSDYFTAKVLYAHDYSLMSLNLNGEASWNESSTNPAGEEIGSLRSYSIELGLNSKTFANGRLDGSVSAKGLRKEEEDSKSLVISEAKLNVHLTDVLRLPVTLSYANRETETVKYGWQLNVGVNALLDEVLRRLK